MRPRAGAGVLAACLVLAVTGVPAPARADTTITTQPYLDSMGITALHAQGLDGSGVTIALIDGPVDTTVPELQGVDIRATTICPATWSPASVAHGTNMAAILASPAYGWAPKATILSYETPMSGDTEDPDALAHDTGGACADPVGYAINQALTAGADVISISQGEGAAHITNYALIRAAEMGVPVAIAAGNNALRNAEPPADRNYAIAVGAIDGTGKRASYSSYGTGLTLMAYGGPPFGERRPDANGHLTVLSTDGRGTSIATPMVAGALALAKQKWPQANGNQLLRVLGDTADGTADHAGQWTQEMGYGILNAPLLVATDPSGYDTTNNLIKDKYALPSAQDVQDYHDGVVDPRNMGGDDTYIYRGCDPDILGNFPSWAKSEPGTAPECAGSASPTVSPTTTTQTTAPTTTTTTTASSPSVTTTQPATPTPTAGPVTPGGGRPGWLLPAIIGLAVVILGLAGVVIVRARRHPTAVPPAGPPGWPAAGPGPSGPWPAATPPPAGWPPATPAAPPPATPPPATTGPWPTSPPPASPQAWPGPQPPPSPAPDRGPS